MKGSPSLAVPTRRTRTQAVQKSGSSQRPRQRLSRRPSLWTRGASGRRCSSLRPVGIPNLLPINTSLLRIPCSHRRTLRERGLGQAEGAANSLRGKWICSGGDRLANVYTPSHERVCSVCPCVSIQIDTFPYKFCLCGGSRYKPVHGRGVYQPASVAGGRRTQVQRVGVSVRILVSN